MKAQHKKMLSLEKKWVSQARAGQLDLTTRTYILQFWNFLKKLLLLNFFLFIFFLFLAFVWADSPFFFLFLFFLFHFFFCLILWKISTTLSSNLLFSFFKQFLKALSCSLIITFLLHCLLFLIDPVLVSWVFMSMSNVSKNICDHCMCMCLVFISMDCL